MAKEAVCRIEKDNTVGFLLALSFRLKPHFPCNCGPSPRVLSLFPVELHLQGRRARVLQASPKQNRDSQRRDYIVCMMVFWMLQSCMIGLCHRPDFALFVPGHPPKHEYLLRCIPTYLPTYLPTCLPACRHTYIHTSHYIHTYMHIYMHTYILIHTYMHACMHAYVRTYVRTYIHAYRHTSIHAYILAFMRTQMFVKSHLPDQQTACIPLAASHLRPRGATPRVSKSRAVCPLASWGLNGRGQISHDQICISVKTPMCASAAASLAYIQAELCSPSAWPLHLQNLQRHSTPPHAPQQPKHTVPRPSIRTGSSCREKITHLLLA